MAVLYLAVIFIFGLGVGAAIIFFRNSRKSEGVLMLQNQINEIARMLDLRLGESTKLMHSQFSESARIIRDVTEQLTKLDETNRQVVHFTDELRNLQDILQNPKQRGILGEYFLEAVLKNTLPPGSFQMQYSFADGSIVDAVIFVKDKIIPVDSKFSLENYNRILEERDPAARERLEQLFKQDLKNRIDESAKYVRPEEGTMEFAMMFIPSEAVYYDLLINKVGTVKVNTEDLVTYAFREKRVIIVSPTSFLAYLQTILQGLRALQIEESAKEIRKRVGELSRHLLSYDDFMQKLGKNLGSTVGVYNNAYREFRKIDKDVLRISGEAMGVEPLVLDKPEESL